MQLNLSFTDSKQSPKPFLRWAGGKRWLIKHLGLISSKFIYNNYHEPFLGSGVLFFHLNPDKISYLSDLNSELIETYLAIKYDVEAVIFELGRFKNNQSDYYRLRESKFRNEFKRAARFIFLNQTSFNGIYRVNLQGKYNVPYGFRSTRIFEPENLKAVSKILQKSIIKAWDFENCKSMIRKSDLVFLDPPYTVTHNNNGFIKYNQKLFSLQDQHRLSFLIDFIKSKQAYYILTNASHSTVEQIFGKGDKKLKIERASIIGGINAQRGKYEEIIFTNVE